MYFKAWVGVPLRWVKCAWRPIPQSWHAIDARASGRAEIQNDRASHPLNAMLNYAYAVLQSQVQIEAVAGGYDPTLGIMHNGYKGSPALVFDLMESRRPTVDAAVLAFALAQSFSPADFLIRSDGTMRLMPQLARRLCQIANASVSAQCPIVMAIRSATTASSADMGDCRVSGHPN